MPLNHSVLTPAGGTPPFTPLSLSPAVGWDFGEATSVTTVSGAVSQINDPSTNARNFTQITAGSRPLYVSAAQNGLNVGRFDGSNDYMTASMVLSGAFTLVYAFKMVVAGVDKTIAAGNALYSYTQAGGSANWSAFGSSALNSATVADTNAHVLSIVYNGGSSTIRLDGTQIATGGTGTTAITTGLALGADPSGAKPTNVDHMQGYLYNSALSVGNQQLVEAFLKARWATT